MDNYLLTPTAIGMHGGPSHIQPFQRSARNSNARLQRTPVLFGLISLLLLFVCFAAMLWQLLPLQPWYYHQARQHWNQQAINHYEMEVVWSSDWSQGHVRAQIRDKRIVGGEDVQSGQSLVPLKLESAGYGANYFMVVENLFGLIEAQMRPAANWRTQVARYHPLLSVWLDPCAAPLPQIEYDDQFGYPEHIHYVGNPCRAQGDVNITIIQFQPLP